MEPAENQERIGISGLLVGFVMLTGGLAMMASGAYSPGASFSSRGAAFAVGAEGCVS
jgi:hypothetical protein